MWHHSLYCRKVVHFGLSEASVMPSTYRAPLHEFCHRLLQREESGGVGSCSPIVSSSRLPAEWPERCWRCGRRAVFRRSSMKRDTASLVFHLTHRTLPGVLRFTRTVFFADTLKCVSRCLPM